MKETDAGNPGGVAVSSRDAAPALRYGPSGDTATPPGYGFAMAGRELPARTGPAGQGILSQAATFADGCAE